jgi:hypothetical protein
MTRLQVLVGPIGALGRCHLFRVRHERRVRTTDGALLGLRPALADRHLAALPVRVAQLTEVFSPGIRAPLKAQGCVKVRNGLTDLRTQGGVKVGAVAG